NGNQLGLHFVLVHGSSHGAWCLYKIRALIETSGHKVTCLDLKGSGIDSADPNTIFTFAQYNCPPSHPTKRVFFILKVVLVGHSAGGLSLTDAIHKNAEKILFAVFVAANMMKNGLTDCDMHQGDPNLSEHGYVSKFIYGLGPNQPPTSVIMKPEFQWKIVEDHLGDFNKIILDMENIDIKIEDEDQVIIVLNSLPSDRYEHFVDTIMYENGSLTLEEIQSALMSKDLKKKSEQNE
ncbi:methylesterase 17-like, partial [Humulus lupulus]|uniref:methylesterase 17-like n=1 Tax=Humulus lupulus TaxID=3486 RepID=UPI002B40C951